MKAEQSQSSAACKGRASGAAAAGQQPRISLPLQSNQAAAAPLKRACAGMALQRMLEGGKSWAR